jgi:hypothetical protein
MHIKVTWLIYKNFCLALGRNSSPSQQWRRLVAPKLILTNNRIFSDILQGINGEISVMILMCYFPFIK